MKNTRFQRQEPEKTAARNREGTRTEEAHGCGRKTERGPAVGQEKPLDLQEGVTGGPEVAISVAEENRGQVLRNPGGSGPRIWGPLLWESCWGWEDGGGECRGGRWKVKL